MIEHPSSLTLSTHVWEHHMFFMFKCVLGVLANTETLPRRDRLRHWTLKEKQRLTLSFLRELQHSPRATTTQMKKSQKTPDTRARAAV